MRRSTMLLMLFALVVMAFAGSMSFASHCESDIGEAEAPHDPFGSCEDNRNSSFGDVECGAGGSGGVTRADVPMVGSVLVKNASDGSAGVQACQDKDANVTPVQGRVTAYKSANNTVTVASDGDDQFNPSGARAWTRVDVSPSGIQGSGCGVRQRRSSAGDYWTAANPDGGSSTTPQLADNCIVP